MFEFKELIIPEVIKDTTVILSIQTETIFTIINENRTNTPYLFYPNVNYSTLVTQNNTDLKFTCQDTLKEFECNALNLLELKKGKINISGKEDPEFNQLARNGKYSYELDSYYTLRKNLKLKELDSYKKEKKISQSGYEYLKKYIEYAFIRNRLVQFYDSRFDKDFCPAWFKDSISKYISSFEDTSLINTNAYKGALRCINLFLSVSKYGTQSLSSQFSTAKKFSNTATLNDMLMVYIIKINENI